MVITLVRPYAIEAVLFEKNRKHFVKTEKLKNVQENLDISWQGRT